ncbi:MAG: DUF2236 domain-containing protein [Proteobacteria bacterium]|nr:DUF2236 domain-containing protein [Pseudomonadota bacterium]MCP4917924.1 DUF2236 domain-containing protein [Pseudomonadota bacterium]
MERFVHADAAVARFGADRVARYTSALSEGDPLADELVAVIAELGRDAGMSLVDEALASGPRADHPEALRAYMDHLESCLVGVDHAAIARGGTLLRQMAPIVISVFKGRSLPLSYAPPAANKPLIATGRLHDDAQRRLAETGKFAFTTAMPGGLERYGESFRITARVRLMHSAVRRRLAPDWNAGWGTPICQADMAYTILLFSTVILDGLRQVGVRVSDADGACIMQLYALVARLIGVREDLVCSTEAQGHDLFELYQMTSAPPDDDARKLMKALLESHPPLQAHYYRGVARGLLGPGLAAQMGVSNGELAWYRGLEELASRAYRLAEVARVQDLMAQANTHIVELLVRMELGDRPASYDPPVR